MNLSPLEQIFVNDHRWSGDKEFPPGFGVDALIATDPEVPITKEARFFYGGSQWSDEEQAERAKLGKPCCVFNQLEPLMEKLFLGPEPAHDDKYFDKALKAQCILVKRNRDAQIAYNRMLSDVMSYEVVTA